MIRKPSQHLSPELCPLSVCHHYADILLQGTDMHQRGNHIGVSLVQVEEGEGEQLATDAEALAAYG
jgi:hypothetical protein